ncbi:MAG: hypothetical protein OXC65_07340 [Thiotrichales bacterium]|nr:hypothetical protein [Thiotrichales bacterium]
MDIIPCAATGAATTIAISAAASVESSRFITDPPIRGGGEGNLLNIMGFLLYLVVGKGECKGEIAAQFIRAIIQSY